MDGIIRIYGTPGQGQEIESGVEEHAAYKGCSVGQCDDTLAFEQSAWYHRVGRKFGFPDDPATDEDQTDQETAKDICGRPRMGVATSLESDEAVVVSIE